MIKIKYILHCFFAISTKLFKLFIKHFNFIHRVYVKCLATFNRIFFNATHSGKAIFECIIQNL